MQCVTVLVHFGTSSLAESSCTQKGQDGRNKAKYRVTKNDINLSPVGMVVVVVVDVVRCYNPVR